MGVPEVVSARLAEPTIAPEPAPVNEPVRSNTRGEVAVIDAEPVKLTLCPNASVVAETSEPEAVSAPVGVKVTLEAPTNLPAQDALAVGVNVIVGDEANVPLAVSAPLAVKVSAADAVRKADAVPVPLGVKTIELVAEGEAEPASVPEVVRVSGAVATNVPVALGVAAPANTIGDVPAICQMNVLVDRLTTCPPPLE